MKTIMMLDTRELGISPLNSLGLILKNLIPFLKEDFDLILLTDTCSKEHEALNVKNIISMGYPARSSLDLIKYHYWISKKVNLYRPRIFFQINHFIPFKLDNSVLSIAEIHDMYPLEGIENINLLNKAKFYFGIKNTIKHSDFIIVPSNFTYVRLKKYFYDLPEVYIVPSPYTPIQTNSLKPKQIDEGEVYFAYIGRLCRFKGTDLLLDLFQDRPFENINLILAGKAEPAFLRLYGDKLNNSAHIKYLGYITEDEKEYLIKNARLFIYPARYDGFGIPPVEAILRRTAVLVSDIPIMREKFCDADVYFNIKNGTESLFKAICKFLSKSEESVNQEISILFENLKSLSVENYFKRFAEIVYRWLK